MRSEPSLTIGELARRAGMPTSTVRYYERRGLMAPDEWESGQRRYCEASLRRLVFIGMLQDAGLSLDDIDGVLGAARASEWKPSRDNVSRRSTPRSRSFSSRVTTSPARCCADTTIPRRTARSWARRSIVASLPNLEVERDLARRL